MAPILPPALRARTGSPASTVAAKHSRGHALPHVASTSWIGGSSSSSSTTERTSWKLLWRTRSGMYQTHDPTAGAELSGSTSSGMYGQLAGSTRSLIAVAPVPVLYPTVGPHGRARRRGLPSHVMTTDLAAEAIHAAKPPDWHVGPPTSGAPGVGAVRPRSARANAARSRSREWTAVAATELEVLREMARCLAIIAEGRVPE